MTTSSNPYRRTFGKAVVQGSLACFVLTASQPTFAALTDISNVPLASTTTTQVKPNIMFILDNSGSMEWEFMPDNVDDSSGTAKIGYKNHLCNTIYFNPAITYVPPKRDNGNNFSAASFSGAYPNGFANYPTGPSSGAVNLGSAFKAYSFDTAQAAYYWKYTGSQALVPSTSGACRDSDTNPAAGTAVSATGGGTWTKTAVPAGEQQNFANWYQYYRDRMGMMKSAASRAFNNLTDSYRVGFITINPMTGSPATVSTSKYTPINDFNSTQRSAWFTQLFSQTGSSSTPLREALSRVGRYYGGMTDGINRDMTPDPVQYSCQQNFAILTTDGYWNGNAGVKLDGTSSIGNQDGDLGVTPRPMWDGGVTHTKTTTDKGNLYQQATCSTAVVNVSTKQLYYFDQQISETHAQSYYFTQQAQRCSNTSNPCSGSFSNTSNSSNRYSGSGGTPNGDGNTYYSCGSRQCRVPTAPAFTGPAYTGWTAAACPSDTGGINYDCRSGASTPVVDLTTGSSCPTGSGGMVYTCTYTPAQPAIPAAPTDPTTLGYTAASTTSCPAGPGGGIRRTCNTTSTAQTTTSTLPAGSACPAAGPGQTVTCTTGTIAGSRWQYRTTTYTQTIQSSGGIVIGNPNPAFVASGPTAWANLDSVCYAGGVGMPSYPTSVEQRPVPAGTPPNPTGGCTAWPCVVNASTPSGGSSNSLADVAQYYYNSDLRTAMVDNVPPTGTGNEDDKATWQHMTTFTLGLGLSGNLTYRSDYKTATTGDFATIRAGTGAWPIPAENSPSALDDLWHAAVNGRGLYFSASDPDSVVNGLTTALAGINARVSSAAAAATSNLEPVAGDNFAYTAKYKTVAWTGELEAHQIDLTTGAVTPTVIWSAQTMLDTLGKNACDNRTIYLYRAGATNNRTPFTWDTYACDAGGAPTGSPSTGLDATEQGNFGSAKIALLSQWPTMTDGTSGTANQRSLAAGAPLVNFLRGQRGKEGFVTNDPNLLYRTREHIFGDVINAQPVYVKAPFASYTDAGYSAYKTANASRAQMVYVAANDGMLHGFDAVTGAEAWAWMPAIVQPNLYRLADNNYANTHTYTVDGTPSVGDAYDSVAGAWKTVLVAGLNAGGKGYYAIDVTDPASPKGLWEFTRGSTCYVAGPADLSALNAGSDCHLGYSFNNPLITKLADGRWVAIVTSGYNNVSGNAGDGQGYLYVLNAITGKIIYKISTGATVGDSSTPSGLNHIVNWVEDTLVNNSTVRVYGADLLGNIWRFDINDTIDPAGREATLIGTAKSPDGTPQPITTRPEIAEANGIPMVFVATGSLLGSSDLASTQVHSIYGVVDPLGATTAYADLRASLKPLTMTVIGTGATATRTIACTASPPGCAATNGWVADLPDTGERVNVDMKLQLGTIVVASNVPENSACTIGGYSWLNYLNYATGEAVSNSPGNVVGQKLSDSLAVGLNIVRLPSGKTVVITTTSDAKQTTVSAPFAVPSPTGRRVSWRELPQ